VGAPRPDGGPLDARPRLRPRWHLRGPHSSGVPPSTDRLILEVAIEQARIGHDEGGTDVWNEDIGED